MSRLNYGDLAAQVVSGRIAAAQATLAALKTIGPAGRTDGQIVEVQADGSRWRFSASSALAGDDLLVVAPASGTGRWLRKPGNAMLSLAIAFGTADAAILLTLQAAQVLQMLEPTWKVTADWTGGAASAIGLSSSTKAGYTTKGDILGGAGGDVAATLVASAGIIAGTVGAQFSSLALRRKLWVAGDTLRFDRITSAFTAGTGFVLLPVNVLQNDGA